jgi:hypothetical protein
MIGGAATLGVASAAALVCPAVAGVVAAHHAAAGAAHSAAVGTHHIIAKKVAADVPTITSASSYGAKQGDSFWANHFKSVVLRKQTYIVPRIKKQKKNWR